MVPHVAKARSKVLWWTFAREGDDEDDGDGDGDKEETLGSC